MIAIPILLAIVVLVLIVRRRRKVVLAGLNSERPVFSVAPPTRRMSGIDREVL